jgi:hypothetical protein
MSIAIQPGVLPLARFGSLVINHGTRALTVSDSQALGGLDLTFYAHHHLIKSMSRAPTAKTILTAEHPTVKPTDFKSNHTIGLSFDPRHKQGVLMQQDQAGNETKIELPLQTPSQRWVFWVMASGLNHLPLLSSKDKAEATKWIHEQLTDIGPVYLKT